MISGRSCCPPGTHAKLQHGPTLSVVEVTTRSFILVVEVTGYQRPVRLPMDLGDNRTLWTPDGFRITVDELAGPKLHAERVTDQVVGEPVFARVERGGRVTVSPELAMTFLGHGHKRTLEGERSPLMVSVAFHAARAATEEAHYNAGGESPSPPPRFQWRDYRFVVVDYGYDTFMKLRIERLAFEQISLE